MIKKQRGEMKLPSGIRGEIKSSIEGSLVARLVHSDGRTNLALLKLLGLQRIYIVKAPCSMIQAYVWFESYEIEITHFNQN